MRGKITMEVMEEGKLGVHVDLEDISGEDRAVLVLSLAVSLHMNPFERLRVAALLVDPEMQENIKTSSVELRVPRGPKS